MKTRNNKKNRVRKHLNFESLEARRLLTVAPFAPSVPFIGFFGPEGLEYNATSDLFQLRAEPDVYDDGVDFEFFDFSSANDLSLAVDFLIDSTGGFVSGIAGNDLELRGSLDLPGGPFPDYDGILLTGEVLDYGAYDLNIGPQAIDTFYFRVQVTGGAMASVFAGQDIGIELSSEFSTFNGVFTQNFSGRIKGSLSPIEKLNEEPVAVGNYVWEDLNADGLQDANEPGIEGVLVHLKDANGDIIDSQFTDQDGYYLFDELPPGTYSVAFVKPAGYEYTLIDSGTDDELDSDANAASNGMTPTTTLAAGEQDLSLDLGLIRLASLGDYVWHDEDTDGIQDANEVGINDVVVTLLSDTDNDGDIDDVVATTMTFNNGVNDGFYEFTNLLPGVPYQVQFDMPVGFDAVSPLDQGSDDTLDSDAGALLLTPIVVLMSGEHNPTLDAGFYLRQPGIDIEKFTNGVNADTVLEAPEIAPGATVTWTYHVTNTGNLAFTAAEVVIVDDAGTPANTADDFSTTSGDIVLVPSSDVGNDGILSPGEVWVFTASSTALTLSSGPVGPADYFYFSGNSYTDGTDGNIRTSSAGSVSVNASAFSRDKSSGAWAPAFLGSYSGGLGVTDSSEGSGGSSMHTVDNVGRDNYVLFEFSESVIIDSVTLGYVVDDSDLSIWIGTLSAPFNNHVQLNDAVLASLGFNEINTTESSSARTANINAGNVAGNVLVVAAWTGDTSPEDRFKLQKLKFNKTSVGYYGNLAEVNVPGASDNDPSYYRNPQQANPGIDIEKLTNGLDADTLAAAASIAPGDTVTWTYVVTNTGNVPFSLSEVVIVDDAGTPGDSSDDFGTETGDIVLNLATDVGADGLLSPGEVWEFTASDIAQSLVTTLSGTASSFILSGNTSTDGTDGNMRTYSSSGVSVKASAFSRDRSNGAWAASYLGAYSGGLGVTDGSEGSGGSNMHMVDNVGRDNYVLFEFSEQVVIDMVTLGYVVGDSDLSIWIGSLADPFNNHVQLSDSLLNNLGFSEVNLTNLSSSRTANINAGNVAGNVLVVAAWTGDSTPDDRFKIQQLKFNKVTRGSYKNDSVVTVPGASDQDPSYYVNPANVNVVDLSVTKSDGVDTYTAGGYTTYTVVVSNNSEISVNGAQIIDYVPVGVSQVTWTAVASAGSTVSSTSGTGDINLLANLAPSGTVTLTVVVKYSSSASGAIKNSVKVVTPLGTLDSNLDNNYASDTNTPVVNHDPLQCGDTASIGFWSSKHGKRLIKSLNSGSSSTALGNWLAASFPHLYGVHAGANNLTGKSNWYVYDRFIQFKNSHGMKVDAQMLATAFAVYVTDKDFAGMVADHYGFNVSNTGTGAKTINIGSKGSFIGLANYQSYTVMQLLQQANAKKQAGSFNSNAFNKIFDNINQAGH